MLVKNIHIDDFYQHVDSTDIHIDDFSLKVPLLITIPIRVEEYVYQQ
jgi:hypothetical protein